MKWRIVIKKFFKTAFFGAVGAVGGSLSSGTGLEGIDPKYMGLVSIITGSVGALVNWYQHRKDA